MVADQNNPGYWRWPADERSFLRTVNARSQQGSFHAPPRAQEPGPDRGMADPQHLRRLGVSQLRNQAQRHDLPIHFSQAVQRLRQSPPGRSKCHIGHDLLGVVRADLRRRDPIQRRPIPPHRAPVVARHIGRGDQQPRQRRTRHHPDVVAMAPRLEEHDRRQVVRVLQAPDLVGAVRVHPLHVSVVQPTERVSIPCGDPRHEVVVNQTLGQTAHDQ